MSVTLAGAILGFLRFNFNPATIFLGDSGSLFIGFMLSALALKGAEKAPTFVAVAIPVVSFGLPILETLLSYCPSSHQRTSDFHRRSRTHPSQTSADGIVPPAGRYRPLRCLRPVCHAESVPARGPPEALWDWCSRWSEPASGWACSILIISNLANSAAWPSAPSSSVRLSSTISRCGERSSNLRSLAVSNRCATFWLRLSRAMISMLSSCRRSNPLNDHARSIEPKRRFHWSKFPHMLAISSEPSWKLTLDLVTTSNQPRGSLIVYRSYSDRDLQLDVNLLTSQFPSALADALDRVLAAPEVLISARANEIPSLAANL